MTVSLDREKKILDYLQKQGSASIQQLTEVCGVSNMTVHRDLNKMEEAGLLKKKHGGVTLASPAAGENICAMCKKSVVERTAFIISMESGEQIRACCAHCGLMMQSQMKKSQALTADFLRGHIISASQAAYVIGSEVNVCCVPSVLSFGSRQDAEKFKKGFGGTLATMPEVIRYLHGMMHA